MGTLLRFAYIILNAFILLILDFTWWQQALMLFCFVLSLPIMMNYQCEQPQRIRNLLRFSAGIYTPVFVYVILFLLFQILQCSNVWMVLSSILVGMFLYFFCKKKVLIPYLLLISNMDYKRAKEENKKLYKLHKRDTSIVLFLYIVFLIVITICLYITYSMEIVYPNVYTVLPLLLSTLYYNACIDVEISGNENNKGKFTLTSILTNVFLILCLCLSLQGTTFIRSIKSYPLVRKEVDQHSFKLACMYSDYNILSVSATKGSLLKSDKQFLKTVDLPVLPVDYEIYFVDTVQDNRKKDVIPDGLTQLKKEKAVSFITNGEENDALEYVFYHEYAHVLFHYMDSYKELLKEYEKIHTLKFDQEDVSLYFVSNYAQTSTLEDMCEVFAYYMCNEDYHAQLKDLKIHRKKCEIIRKYLISEYGYDYYRNVYK